MNAFLWAIGAAVIWGIVPVFEKLGLAKVTPLAGLFYRCFGVVLGLVLLGLFMVKPAELKAGDAKGVFFLVLSGFLASFAAQIFFYNGLKTGDISRIVPVSGSYPLIAFFLGVFLLGETVTISKVMGAGLVVAGVWLLR